MNRPLLIDLFCGAGGAAMGYHRAGFDVIGVDIKPQPRYPFTFVQADALRPPLRIEDAALIHASPPCQAYSMARNNGSGKAAPKLIEQVRGMLKASGRPFVIENVVGAPLHHAVRLCAASWGMGSAGMDLARHRHFEASFLILAPPCQHRSGKTIGIYGHGTNAWHREKIGRNIRAKEMREAMGIDWMRRGELTQAIPPAYTEFIGRSFLASACA